MSKRRKRYRSLGRVTATGTSSGGGARRQRRVTAAMAGIVVVVVLVLSAVAGPSLIFGSGGAPAAVATPTYPPLVAPALGQPFTTLAPIP
jgi:hypothetical protein